MPEYTYRFADLLSDSDICELELSNVRFDRRIIQPGSFSASVSVTNTDIATQVKKIAPARTVLHIYRDADLWGTYIVWQMRVRSSGRSAPTVELQGATLESWFDHRIIDVDMLYTNTDQFDIARGLIDQAQTGWFPYEGNANLGISYGTNDSGVLRDRSYYLTDAAPVGQRLQELANVDNGFEYMITTYDDPSLGIRVRKLVLATKLGDSNLDVLFTYPGSISSYEITYDASNAATAWWARGDTIQDDTTETEYPLITEAPVLSDLWLSNGFPHMDRVIDYASVTVLDTLEDYAAWWRDNHSGIIAVPVIEINTKDTPTIIPPTALGTSAVFTIEDEFFGHGDFSSENRIIGIEVTPPTRGSQEVIRLVIEDDIDPTDVGN
jgi:hypothetical protein